MTGTKLENQIVSIFNRDITLLLSINQIAKKLNKSYPNVNYQTNRLISEEILNKVEIGRSYLCFVNLGNDKAVNLLCLNEIIKKENFLKRNPEFKRINSQIEKLRQEFKIYSIFIHDKKIFVVLDYLNDQDAINNRYPEFKKHELQFVTPLQMQALFSENRSYLKDNIILYAFETYFKILNDIKEQLFGVVFFNEN